MGDCEWTGKSGREDNANGIKKLVDTETLEEFTFRLPSNSELSSADHSVILLAWLLVFYRLNPNNDIECGWGPGAASRTFSSKSTSLSRLTTNNISLKADSLISNSLSCVKQLFADEYDENRSHGSTRSSAMMFLTSELTTGNENGCSNLKWNFHLECKTFDDSIQIQTSWRPLKIDRYEITNFVHAFMDNLTLICGNAARTISACFELTKRELKELRKFNDILPPMIEVCMHDLITERAQMHPTSKAICAWDGDFNYQEIDDYSSALARHLVSIGVQSGTIVPICFEKSRWTSIAVLSVMKAGAGFVLLDPSQPLMRLQTISQEVSAAFIVSSESRHRLASTISPQSQLVIVASNSINIWLQTPTTDSQLPRVVPSSILYVIFTSGSTGKPKGVVIAHNTATSGALPRSEAVGYASNSRVLDFASYAFDVSIDSILCTLMRGGCLCIPSDEDRINDLSGTILRMGVTMANMTPSVARTLHADVIPALESLGLGGEAVAASDVARWGETTRVVIGYGPSECTVGCTINSSAATGKSYTNIGKGVGGVMWIADPDDHNRLVPIGAVGELLVEGPIVGQGYLNDLEKTTSVFIENPVWLMDGSSVTARKSRLYKTGDLVKYDPDGSGCLVFVGRKDSQVKIRGQRVELGEVEYHLRSLLPQHISVAAEVIKFNNGTSEPTLVAFTASSQKQSAVANLKMNLPDGRAEFRHLLEGVEEGLAVKLPIYMVPSIYIPLSFIPILISAKTDRKCLRGFAERLRLQDILKLDSRSTQGAQPCTPAELRLQTLWSQVLKIERSSIGKNTSFFHTGGDSIQAMKLVAAARDIGLSLSVSSVFQHPILASMALVTQIAAPTLTATIPEFSLLKNADVASLRRRVADMCSVTPSMIEDIYPCMPLQEILMAFSAKDDTAYVAQRILQITGALDHDSLVAAWDYVYATSPILRTRIVQSPDHGLVQVVINQKISWKYGEDLQAYLQIDQDRSMTLGTCLSRFAIINDKVSGQASLVWSTHHAIYDGWSTPLILHRVQEALRGTQSIGPGLMKHFISYLQDPMRESSKSYWHTQLRGADGPQFPFLPSRNYQPRPSGRLDRFVEYHPAPSFNTTISTLIRGAWAFVASQYTSSDDVVFGETMTGRTIPVVGAEQIEGPLITTVPVRIRVDGNLTVQQYLQKLHDEAIARMPHEHTGLQNIRKISTDTQIACELKTGLVIQPPIEKSPACEEFMIKMSDADAAEEAIHFNTYPLMLVVSLQKDGCLIMTSFDDSLVEADVMDRILDQIQVVLHELSTKPTVLLKDISYLSRKDLSLIWHANRIPPQLTEVPLVGVDERNPADVEDDSSIRDNSVSWIVDPRDHSRLSPVGAIGELCLERLIDSETCLMDPRWLCEGHELVKGRRGRLYKTGDLVKYADDMSLIFMGRKENHVALAGRIIDLAEIEGCIKQRLPSDIAVVVQIRAPTPNDPLPTGHQSTRLTTVLSWNSPVVSIEDIETTSIRDQTELYTLMPMELLQPLLRLEKSLADVLPPYMIPAIFLPIRNVDQPVSECTRARLQQVVNSVSLNQMIELKFTWRKVVEMHNVEQVEMMTKQELLLRDLWCQVLNLSESEIQLEDSFFRLGGDSIQAMKLVSKVRDAGYSLSVANIFLNMHLSQMAKCLSQIHDRVKEYKAFSALEHGDLASFLAKSIRPSLADPAWHIRDAIPVTERQRFDIMASVDAPRSSIQYNHLFFETAVDRAKLLRCCQELVNQHEILRTVFVRHERSSSYLQVIIEEFKVEFEEHVAQGDLSNYVNQLCERDVEGDFPLGSSFLKFMFVDGELDSSCMIIRISHAQYDGISLPELMRQLGDLYGGGTIPRTTSFRSYVYDTLLEKRNSSLNYWRNFCQKSSFTTIRPADDDGGTESLEPTFITKLVNIDRRPHDITLGTLVASAWAVLLARLRLTKDVMFGSVVTGRTIDLDDVENIMGPTYQYMPVRVEFEDSWTATDLLQYVQVQFATSGPFATVGLNEILADSAELSTTPQYFDSVVHHQDIDYFDELPFGMTSARVEYAIPHPEPAREWKIVSYPKEGKLCIGIEGRRSWVSFTQDKLNDLSDIVTGFMERPNEHIF